MTRGNVWSKHRSEQGWLWFLTWLFSSESEDRQGVGFFRSPIFGKASRATKRHVGPLCWLLHLLLFVFSAEQLPVHHFKNKKKKQECLYLQDAILIPKKTLDERKLCVSLRECTGPPFRWRQHVLPLCWPSPCVSLSFLPRAFGKTATLQTIKLLILETCLCSVSLSGKTLRCSTQNVCPEDKRERF